MKGSGRNKDCWRVDGSNWSRAQRVKSLREEKLIRVQPSSVMIGRGRRMGFKNQERGPSKMQIVRDYGRAGGVPEGLKGSKTYGRNGK